MCNSFFMNMNILRKRIDILYKYVMPKQAIKDCIKQFNFSNSKHEYKNTFNYYFCYKKK